MVQFARHVVKNHVAAILVIAFGVSFVAHAQGLTASPVEPITVSGQTTEEKPKPFRGSSIAYGHSITAMTVYGRGEAFNASVGADPNQVQTGYYNPTWSHAITLAPEWHFNDLFFTRARMFISQELTLSDTTSRPHEVELSDIFWDVVTNGWTEKSITGIKISGDVRFTLPTSKLSQSKQQWLNVGPSLSLIRRFSVRSGLTVGYSARPTLHLNGATTRIKQPTLAPCLDREQSLQCAEDATTGGRNAFLDFGHGPFVSFQPFDTVSIDATMIWDRQWLYKLTPVDPQFQNAALAAQEQNAVNVRDLTRFVLSVNWQFSKPVGVSLTALTVGEQLGADGHYTFPLFNRNTVLFLDASVDVEAVASKLF